MNINRVLTEYDNMFGNHSLKEIEDFLFQQLALAYDEQDYFSGVTLLNEIIGFCRDTSQNDKGIFYCNELVELMAKLRLEGTVEHATSFLNIANAYRAFGKLEESLKLYEQVEQVYKDKVEAGAFSYASLYNNWGLLYQEMERYEDACKVLNKALSIVDNYDAKMEQATTRTNLGVSYLHLYRQNKDVKCLERSEAYVEEALSIYEADGGRDFHYSAALSAMGDLCYIKEDYTTAASYYEKAMRELKRHVGETESYYRVKDNYEDAMTKAGLADKKVRHIDRCKEFYETYGKPMLLSQFRDSISHMAMGMVGEGSDCFGFEDDISKDHDFGLGFVIWLPDKLYAEIGNDVERAYDALIAAHTDMKDVRLNGRRGVCSISGFYSKLLGENFCQNLQTNTVTDNEWLAIPEDVLATATNGEVFEDNLGEFTKLRERLLAYYPDHVWKRRLAKALHDFSQYGQSNYARMMARVDYTTANLCITKTIESTMDIAYLLNKQYAPYYKWKRRGMEHMQGMQELTDMLDALSFVPCQKLAWVNVAYDSRGMNDKDEAVLLIEKIANYILLEMRKRKLVSGDSLFLEHYCKELMMEENRLEIIDKIVVSEWEQFDKVKNEGGRADCQDDWNTFSVMRKSQYLAWELPLLESYLTDLERAKAQGWNLIMEKYARMMKSTTPEKYEELKDELPVRSEERIAIQEEIIKIQVAWMEEFAGKYPKMAGNARSIHTYEDNPYNTSYETYLRGELGTYSEETFILYTRFIIALSKQGENLAYQIMDNTAKLYGYTSVEAAEEKL